jgi:histidine ammonia-lyase
MESMRNCLLLDGQSLSLAEMEAVALKNDPVALAPEARQRVAMGRELIEQILAAGQTVYGVNTGFGALSDVSVPAGKLAQLQTNLVRSHAGGVGQPMA